MPKVNCIGNDGVEHVVEIPSGTSVMRGPSPVNYLALTRIVAANAPALRATSLLMANGRPGSLLPMRWRQACSPSFRRLRPIPGFHVRSR